MCTECDKCSRRRCSSGMLVSNEFVVPTSRLDRVRVRGGSEVVLSVRVVTGVSEEYSTISDICTGDILSSGASTSSG